MDNNAVLFLLGPTATGKTALSFALAEALNAEIISVDSALVYRGMDIGTAKPSAAERAAVPHHLIDVCEPHEPYSAARFCDEAMCAIHDIQTRGKTPLLVGGTMLYFHALETGLAPLPDANEQLRAELSLQAEHSGWAALHQRLVEVDPVAAQRINPNDPQRIQRALEVYTLTGEPLSELQKRTVSPLAEKPIKFALLPDSRAWLHARIAARFKLMLDAGFLEEVQLLRRDPRLHCALPSIRSVGYRQAWQHLDGEYDLSTLLDKSTAATRQLAKRQITWLRGMQNYCTVACDTLGEEAQTNLVLDQLKNSIGCIHD